MEANKLTEEELVMLEECQSPQEWSVACRKIKNPRGQAYPDDWWVKVKESGMMERIHNRWGATSEIQMRSFDNKDDLFNHLNKH
jgi:hypothetical protein